MSATPKSLLSVDPGIRGCGVSLFVDGALATCAFIRNPDKTGHGPAEAAHMAEAVAKWLYPVLQDRTGSRLLDDLTLEFPQIYQRKAGKSKGDPNDLLPLAAVDGALATIFSHAKTSYVLPAQWKGQVDKDDDNAVIRSRIEARLAPAELAVFGACVGSLAKSVAHNVIDAVAVGMHALGRFDRKRVFQRE